MIKKLKKRMIIVAIVIGLCASIIFYFVFAYRPKDVSNKTPYAPIINTKLVTIEDAIIIKNSTTHYINEYPNELQDFHTINTSVVDFIKIPKGSVIEFQKAVKVSHFVSGGKYVYLLGNLLDEKMNYTKPIIYQWGYFKTICIDDDCNYWEHRKAPWQEVIDERHYK